MHTRTVKKNGNRYVLSAEMKNGTMSVAANGIVAETVYYNEKCKVWYAPYSFEEGNFWLIVYKGKPYLSAAGEVITQDSFERDYLPPAFNKRMSALIMLTAIILPLIGCCAFFLNHEPKSYISGIIMVSVLYVVYYFLMNRAPVATSSRRRKLCLWVYTVLIYYAALILLEILLTYFVLGVWVFAIFN